MADFEVDVLIRYSLNKAFVERRVPADDSALNGKKKKVFCLIIRVNFRNSATR